jgi:hypothetical protein
MPTTPRKSKVRFILPLVSLSLISRKDGVFGAMMNVSLTNEVCRREISQQT